MPYGSITAPYFIVLTRPYTFEPVEFTRLFHLILFCEGTELSGMAI